jgi:hypothetical protein
LATQIKSMNKRIDIDGTNLSLLLYADDIVILAPNESNLQFMLNCVNKGELGLKCKIFDLLQLIHNLHLLHHSFIKVWRFKI